VEYNAVFQARLRFDSGVQLKLLFLKIKCDVQNIYGNQGYKWFA